MGNKGGFCYFENAERFVKSIWLRTNEWEFLVENEIDEK